MRLRILPAARRDLQELRAYIAVDDAKTAMHVGLRLDKAFALICERPNIGRPTPNRPAREWSVPGLPYLIPYRTRGDVVEIVRVWRTSRKRPAEW